ncbi:hypothetical protein SAMN05216418_1455 [Microbacterium enclense]|uniref:Uncharacterized protein n=2 Tax=Microbacterium enclense TaxID=993073 RepID=A0A1G6ID61_9MICO|nr:hypothetical protein SAMN05216418_1455 [Microbacterium enclense]
MRNRWAHLKLTRAWWLFSELHGRVDLWNATSAFRAPLRLAANRTTLEFLVPSQIHVPLDEWALLAGDAVHNARSALDALVWGFATANGREPGTPHRVSFPVTANRTAWRSAAKALDSVPAEVLERIEAVQPWNDNLPSDHASWLEVATRLDNDDKHRGAMVAMPVQESFDLDGMSVRLGEPTELGAFMHIFENGLDGSTTPGTPFARFSFGAVILEGSVLPETAVLPLAPGMTFRGSPVATMSLQQEMLSALTGICEWVETGEEPTSATILPESYDPDPSNFDSTPAEGTTSE